MIFAGKNIRVEELDSGNATLVFDLANASVNKFDQATLEELDAAISAVSASKVRGLIFTSGKSGFIVGADIMEFTALFRAPEATLLSWLEKVNGIFNAIEDLPIPTISLLNGVALGGGFELAIATDFRLAVAGANVGFPEVKLGICPGFGGTVRLPRLIGADNANMWISSGMQVSASQALKEGAIDGIVTADQLIPAAEKMLEQARTGKLDIRAIRHRKTGPLMLAATELMVAFETAKAMVAAQAGRNYPAPLASVSAMHTAAVMDRRAALQVEHATFAKLARTPVAANLVQIFINEQYLNGKARKIQGQSRTISRVAVLGAGIMGGGIAYQSALKGVPVFMKDIAREGLELGMAEAHKQLANQVDKGRLQNQEVLQILSRIQPSLSFEGIVTVDLVVEAVVENPDVKRKVLAEVEQKLDTSAIIATNTSTISVTGLASALARPENFCGMHFFNPVPVMPLVEVIRGKLSSDATIATVVNYARTLGKTPIVVNDCPGFLVNRILFPYFGAFARLIHDGADFRRIDAVMEKFGWPMGPAYLLDVVGIDTAVHAQAVMAAGFPDRMTQNYRSAMDVLFENKRYGQKSGSGFYLYQQDKQGKPKKQADESAHQLLQTVKYGSSEISDQQILDRMMLCMCLETVRCLEDGIVGSAIEADMGLVLGLGFPPFRGGALRYIDALGVSEFCRLADAYVDLGPLYWPTAKLREMAAAGATFYPGQEK